MDIKKLYSLKLIGFNEKQQENFASVLFLAERGLRGIWKIVETDVADYYLFTRKKISGLPKDRCIFYAEEPSRDGSTELLVDSNNIPKLRTVIEVFNRITENPVEPQVAADVPVKKIEPIQIIQSKPPVSPSPASTPRVIGTFNPNQGFLTHLLNVKDDFVEFSFRILEEIYLDSVNRVFYSTGDLDILSTYFSSEQEFSVTAITAAQLKKAVQNALLTPRPLSSLIWYVAYKLSPGKLLEGHSSDDLIYLTRWPDLEIPECRSYVKLVAFLRSHAVSLATASTETGMPVDQVIDFYNACYLAGMIEKPESIEKVKGHIDVDKQLVLENINKQLKKLNLVG